MIINFDDIDQSLKVGLTEWHRTGAEVFPHGPAKPFDQRGLDPNGRACLFLGAFQSGDGSIALSLESVEAVLQNFVDFRQSLFYEAVETAEFVFAVRHLALQGYDPTAHGLRRLSAASG